MDLVERSIFFERNPIPNLTLPWRLIRFDSIGAIATDDRHRGKEEAKTSPEEKSRERERERGE